MAESGNALYLVCEVCSKANEPDYGFKLADRGVIGAYQVFGPAKHTEQFAQWLKKHARCGAKNAPDHFQLAHLKVKNYDQPETKPKRPILTLAG